MDIKLCPKVDYDAADMTYGISKKFEQWPRLKDAPYSKELETFLTRNSIFDFSPYCRKGDNFAIEVAYKYRIFMNLTYEKYFDNEDFEQFTCHEVIRECRLFADLDDHEGKFSKKEFDELKNKLIQSLPNFIIRYFQFENPISINIIQSFSPEPWEYNSAHLFVEIIKGGLNDFKYVLFKSPSDQFNFWRDFLKAYPEFYKIMDTQVYSHIRQFRFHNSAKFDKLGSKHDFAAQKGIFVYPIDRMYFKNTDERDEYLDNLYLDTEFDDYFSDNYIDLKYSCCAMPDSVFRVHDKFKEFIVSKEPSKKIYSKYELKYFDDLFNYVIDKAPNPSVERKKRGKIETVKKFDRYFNWSSFVRKMKSIFYFKKPAEVLAKIENFMAKRGWGDEYAIKETRALFECAAYSDYSYQSFIKFLDVEFFDNPHNYTAPKVLYLPLEKLQASTIKEYMDMRYETKIAIPIREKYRVVQVCKSACDTQKTRSIMTEYPHLNILFVTYRVFLKDDVKNKFKVADYQDPETRKQIAKGEFPQYLAVQFESLHLLKSESFHYDLAFIDEAPHLIGQIEHSRNNTKHHYLNMQVFTRLLRTKHLILSSANINYVVWKFVKTFLGKEEIFYSNNIYISGKKKYEIQPLSSVGHFREKMIELLKEDKKLCISTNSAKEALNLYLWFGVNFKNKKFKVITKKIKFKEDKQDCNNVWINYDAVIYSPVVESGVSFEIENHFDHICNISINKSTHHLSIFQQLYRCRNPKSKIVYSFCENAHYDAEGNKKIPKTLSEYEILSGLRITDYMKQFKNKNEALNKLNEFKFDYDFSCPEEKTLILSELYASWSKQNLRTNLYNELRENGCTILPKIVGGPDKEELKEQNNFLKSLRNKFIENSLQDVLKKIDQTQKLKDQFDKINWENNSEYFINLTAKLINIGINTEEKINSLITKCNREEQSESLYRHHKFNCLMAYYPELPIKVVMKDDKIDVEIIKQTTELAFICKLFKNIGNERNAFGLNTVFDEFLNDPKFADGLKKIFPSTIDNYDKFGDKLRRINGIISKINLKFERSAKSSDKPGYNILKLVKIIDIQTINPFEYYLDQLNWVKNTFRKKFQLNEQFEEINKYAETFYSLTQIKDENSKKILLDTIPCNILKIVAPHRCN